MKRIAIIISSPLSLAILALPPALWLCFVVYGMKLSPLVAAGTWAFKLYYTALLAAAAVRAALSFQARRYGPALMALGIGAVLLQGIYVYGFRFSGKTNFGEGEGPAGFYAVEAGPWSRLPVAPVLLKKAAPGASDTVTVTLDGREQDLAKGRTLPWKDFKLTLTTISEAPLFILSSVKGAELEAGFIKLFLDRPTRDSFQFRVLPHRFYVSPPGGDRERWIREGDGWKRMTAPQQKAVDAAGGEVLRLMIMRGKIVLLDRDVKKGERVFFEGYAIRFEHGAPWVELSVEKVPERHLFHAGLVILLFGGLVTVLRRRSA